MKRYARPLRIVALALICCIGISSCTEDFTSMLDQLLGSNDENDPNNTNGTNGTDDPVDTWDGIVATPSVSPEGGSIAALSEVILTCATSGTTIYYTTDGSTPDESSIAYSEGSRLLLYDDTTLTVVAIRSGVASEVVTADYSVGPLHSEFAFPLSSGTRWDYHYTWRHTVFFSYSGDSSFTSEWDFSVILGDSTVIDGLTAYQVIVVGNFDVG